MSNGQGRSTAIIRGSLLPIVFLGPSLSHAQARDILKADYRPPIRRGDFQHIPAGSIVAIIDGVFDQALAVSPTEIRAAMDRGIRILGASSMGALRAVEVPGVRGVGRIYEMYRMGIIDSDDEVAVVFDPETLRPLSEPLVNVRYAVEQLVNPGTISRDLGAKIIRAARQLPYPGRCYREILKVARLDGHKEGLHLIRMLAAYDLKRQDAITLLEELGSLDKRQPLHRPPRMPRPARLVERVLEPELNAPVQCWEFGPPLPFNDLLPFLALTGALSKYSVKALAGIEDEELLKSREAPGCASSQDLRDRLLAQTARAWHWVTEEEVATSLADLGLRKELIEASLQAHVNLELRAMALTRAKSDRFFAALRHELFLDDLALKREVARAVSLDWLANRGRVLGGETVNSVELREAGKKLCEMLDVRDMATALKQVGWWGILPRTVHEFVSKLALARRVGPYRQSRAPVLRNHTWLRSSPKATGSRRFCTTLARAYSVTKRLRPVVGITRVAVITGLGSIGIPNAQAFRPDGEWSSTIGSGKSSSTVGAKVGAIMEEIEKWAQEEFTRHEQAAVVRVSSFENLRGTGRRAVDPATLDLPYDTCYTPDLEIGWHWCTALPAGKVLVPSAAITHRRVPNDIFYSPRGARKTVSTNGLASGMTVAEAITHAMCECIERHARALDSIANCNPGGPTYAKHRFLDLETLPHLTRRLTAKILRAGHRLVVRNIQSDINVPTFGATILLSECCSEGQLFGDGCQRASGWATHPDPETAVNMAILEASQTVMTHIAGAREDLLLHARSLGRHERTNSCRRLGVTADIDVDAPRFAFGSVAGFSSSDAANDVCWILERLRQAGYEKVLIADYSTDRIKPVRVVRAMIPGLETNNPFHAGLRARKSLLSDMLPYDG